MSVNQRCRNRQRQVISDRLMVMTVASQAEWMVLIEQCVCDWTVVQMEVISMVAIKHWEFSGQG